MRAWARSNALLAHTRSASSSDFLCRERQLYRQPTGPNPINPRDDFSRPALRHRSLIDFSSCRTCTFLLLAHTCPAPSSDFLCRERDSFIDNLLVRIHLIDLRRPAFSPWVFELFFQVALYSPSCCSPTPTRPQCRTSYVHTALGRKILKNLRTLTLKPRSEFSLDCFIQSAFA